ncbi:hypothetical protein KVR01_007817 [Diaporthe batatas]|uniref:uncharacterized protein n=1 Tax=Diaporthe batatas TaxID=748121 RepID=UPI001D0598D1|nr:uncharacterized protein KVR01_007817 [Diaporthe batatas]KAG8162052.1 hypothetical protein KVR01_007817 [Diaporthe batatas]
MERLLNNMQGRDTPTIPAVCFDACNNANLEAQARGKVPSLCDPGSAFLQYLEDCNKCIDQNGGESAAYVSESFAQYLNFCSASSATATGIQAEPTSATATSSISLLSSHEISPPIPTSWLTYYETLERITASNLAMEGTTIAESTVIYVPSTITSTKPAYFFHVSVQSLVSSYIPLEVFSDLAASAVSAASAASVTGDPTSLIYAALEDVSRPPWFSAAVPATYTAEMSSLEASINELRATPISTLLVSSASDSAAASVNSLVDDTASPDSGNKAWIAGAVVGSVVGTALIILGMILFLRRQKLAARVSNRGDDADESTYMTGFKPELHAEAVQRPPQVYEMDASQSPSEMAVQEKPQELHADR